MIENYKAAAYMRLSVANERVAESESISNQQHIIRHFIESRPDIELVSEWVDDGHSGVVFDRPSFMAMIQDVVDGKINCIVVKDLSRFGREFSETGRYLRKLLPAYGVRFIAILDGVDTNRAPAQDDLILQIKTVINDEFSRELSVKTRHALLSMRKSGLYVGACPVYGYRKSDEIKNRLVVDEYAAIIVRDIFRMKIEGFGASAIADKLNDCNVLSPLEYKKSLELPFPKNGFSYSDNAKWSVTTIFRILKDETYTGTLIQGKQYTPNYKIRKQFTRPPDEWIRVEDAHEAVISKFDFETVQRIMQLDTRTAPGMDKANLFSGILLCRCCNGNMTRKTVTHKGIAYAYYRCPNGKKYSCSYPASIREDVLVAKVFQQIEDYLASIDAFIQRLGRLSNKEMNQELTKGLVAQLNELQNKLDQNVFFKSSLSSSLINGLINEDEYANMKASYAEKISELERKIEIIVCKIRNITNHREERVQWLNDICKYAGEKQFNRALIVTLVKSIFVGRNKNVDVEFVVTVDPNHLS